MEHAVTTLHVIGAALWLGALAAILVNHKQLTPQVVKRTSLIALAGQVIIAVTGLTAAAKYGDPSAWMKMGTTVGKIGEKITALTLSAIIAGVSLHHLVKGMKNKLVTTGLTLSIVITLGAIYLGTSLARGI